MSAHSQKNILRSVLGLSLLGWAFSAYTLLHRQGLLTRGLEEASACNLGDRFNCDAVALSSYSVFAGLPVSAWGLAFYGMLFVLGLWGYFQHSDHNENEAKNAASWISLASMVSLIPTVILAGTSLFVIRSVCIFCVGIYLVNIALAIAGFMLKKSMRAPSKPGGLPTALLGLIGGLTILLLFSPRIIETSMNDGRTVDEGTIQALVYKHVQSSSKVIRSAGYPTMGPDNASVTIVEFSDFQCPYCKQAAATLPAFASARTDKIRIVFRNYPLDSSCNAAKGIPTGMHPHSCQAAKTGICVFKKAGSAAFFHYADQVFGAQEKLSADFIKQAGVKHAGLDIAQLDECVNSPLTHQALIDETTEGTSLGIEGTPSIYINGKFIESGANAKVLKPILDSYFN